MKMKMKMKMKMTRKDTEVTPTTVVVETDPLVISKGLAEKIDCGMGAFGNTLLRMKYG